MSLQQDRCQIPKVTRRCIACTRELAEGEGLYHGHKVTDPLEPFVKCADCDYADYQGQYGGL
jgi:hypothetical protein